MVIVETSVWIDLLNDVSNPQTDWLLSHQDTEIGLLDLSLCEVLQGMRSDALLRRARTQLMQLPVFSTGGSWMMLAAAENYRALRKRGVTVRSTIDCTIATYCIQRGYDLLHRDRDFDGFEKHLRLRVVHP